MKLPASFYSGTSGLQLPVPKYLFPPPYQYASRLTYYSTFFNSIEINSSFYKVPMSATVKKWSGSVPADFKFTFKLWKQVTHIKDLRFEEEDVEFFLKSVADVDVKKGCLLIQFPPSLGIENIIQLDNLLNCITKNSTGYQLVIEFRNSSWYTERAYEVLNFYNAALVVHDMRKSATPMTNIDSKVMYLRFHGPEGNYRGSYSEDFLSEYSEYLKDWLEEGKSVYVYFNNTAGDAFNNLKTLNTYMSVKT